MRKIKSQEPATEAEKRVVQKFGELEIALKTLQYSDERYRIAAENSSEIILDYNILNGSMYHTAKRISEIYGIPQQLENAKDFLVENGIVLEESAKSFLQMFRRIEAGEPKAMCTIQTKTKTGEILWDEVILTTVFGADGSPVRAIGVLKDVTQQRVAEIQYKNELLYRNAMKKHALLFYEADLTHKKVLSGLDKIMEAAGVPYTDDYDKALNFLVETMVYPEDRPVILANLTAESMLRQHLAGVGKVEVEYRRMTKSGAAFWVQCSAYITEDKQEEILRGFYYFHDIDKMKQEEIRLREKAERDSLTSLYNKGTTEQLIKKCLMEPLDQGHFHAFMIVDLDDFKNINDQLGHAFGDAVLSETALKLKSIGRSGDIAGRIGGDEFVLFLKDLPSLDIIKYKADQICGMFRDAYTGVMKDFKISGTAGISVMPNHGSTFKELYRNADLALYAAKKLGKDTYYIYDEEIQDLDVESISRADIEGSEGKTFSDNVIEYVFRILYESRDLQCAIEAVLELVSKHYGYSRSYIYERSEIAGSFYNSFEWCAGGVAPMEEKLKTVSGGDLEDCRKLFSQMEIYIRKPEDKMTFPAQPFCGARYQFSLPEKNVFQGFVGFDRYQGRSEPERGELSTLSSVVQMLDIFLAEKRANDKAVALETMLQAVADSLHTCTYIIEPDTYKLQFVNQNTKAMIPRALPGTVCYETIRGRSEPCADCPIAYMVDHQIKDYMTEMYLDPYRLWAKINSSLITMEGGRELGLFNGYDFTEYKDRDGRYIVDEYAFTGDATLYRVLCHSTDDYIFMCDMTKNLFYFPLSMVEEFNLPGQIVEDAITLWGNKIHENDRESFQLDMGRLISGESNYHNSEYRVMNREGKWVWLRCTGYLEHNENGAPTLFAGIITNLEKKIKIDFLSGLPNKYEFEVQVRSKLAANPLEGALLLIGLDNFKNVNNLYGWDFGDHVLHETAQKIQTALPPDLQVYRLDGDTFGIFFFEGAGGAIEEAYCSISAIFQQQQQYQDQRYYCTVSGGYSLFADELVSFNTLFKQAEFALEYSKLEGKNRLSRYDSETMAGKERMLKLIERLRESVDHDFEGFELYFQPQIQAESRQIKSAEALLRWKCLEYGPVSPVEFIPLLEQTGLIQAVGRWVLIHAADVCREWKNSVPDFVVNVNVSFAQLQDLTFIPYLSQLIERGLLDPFSIHLELTESCIVEGSRSLTDAFEQLRNLGFCIEMDDFGTGYSSLEILKNAPADVVKIDRAFVTDITKSDFDATFIQFVVALCHSVNIRVCLEGVETWEEYRMVEVMAVDMIQGFLFGRPQRRADFESMYLSAKE